MSQTLELERLMVRLLGDGSGYQKMLKDAELATNRTAKHVQDTSKGIEGFASSLVGFASSAVGAITTLLATAGIGGVWDTFRKSISLAGAAEENETFFGVMLQNAEKGKDMVKDLQAFAAATPLDTSNLQTATKTLLQFGVEGENIIPTLRMLGDVTGGNAQRLHQMSLAFGQMSSAGRLMGQDLLQMINAGFNPLQEISRVTGKSVIELKKEMEKGAISSGMVARAFKSATSEGGRFFQGMEKASKTMVGLFSTMQDDIDAALRSIGKSLMENLGLKEIIKQVSLIAKTFSEWFKNLSDGTKQAIINFTAVAVVIGTIGLSIAGLTASIWLAVAAGTALNISLGGLPLLIGGIVTATAAAVAITYAWIESVGGIAKIWEPFGLISRNTWDRVTSYVTGFVNTIRPIWNGITTLFMFVWGEISSRVNTAFQSVKKIIQNFVTNTAPNFQKLISGIVPVLARILLAFRNTFQNMLPLFETLLNIGVATFEGILKAVEDFINFFTPIWQAWASLVGAVFETVLNIAGFVWAAVGDYVEGFWKETQFYFGLIQKFIDNILNAIGFNSQTTWTDIALGVQRAILTAEFVLRNFSRVADRTFKSIRLSFFEFVELVNYFFTAALPAFGQFLLKAWTSIFQQIFDISKETIHAITKIIQKTSISIFANINQPEKWEGFVRDAIDAVANELVKHKEELKLPPLELPPIQKSEASKVLREQLNKLDGELFTDLQDFIEKRKKEFSQPMTFENPAWKWFMSGAKPKQNVAFDWLFGSMQEVKDKSLDIGSEIGINVGKGIEKEIRRWDVAASGSLEAMMRLEEFRERNKIPNPGRPQPFNPNQPLVPRVDLSRVPQLQNDTASGLNAALTGQGFQLKEIIDGVKFLGTTFGDKIENLKSGINATLTNTRDALIARFLSLTVTNQNLLPPLLDINGKISALDEIKLSNNELVAQGSNPNPAQTDQETKSLLERIALATEALAFSQGVDLPVSGLN